MRHILVLIAVALLAQGCATVRVARNADSEDLTVTYSGSARGAADLIRADVRRHDAETTRQVATGAVEHGQPVSVSSTPNTTSLSTGYTYGSYGYGQVAADVVIMPGGASGYVTYGVGIQGSLPVLSQGSYAVSGSTQVSSGTASCPDDPKVKRTPEQEMACLRESVDWLIDREGSP